MTPSQTPPVPNPIPPDLLTYIANHATAAVPLTDLAGVLITVLGQETLIANDQPAPGYILIFLNTPPPTLSH